MSAHDQKTEIELKPLLFAQFTGAFNDNAWKMIVTFLLLAAAGGGADSTASQSQDLTSRAFLIFTLPLVLFSLPAAYLADRIGKDRIIRAMKALEVMLMLAGAVALYFDPQAGWATLFVLGAMGAQSAIFSPAKYGIIPELVKRDRIVAANGALELATFVAIILGTGAGGLLLESAQGQPTIAAGCLAVFAAMGYLAARRIPRLAPAGDAAEKFTAALGGGWRALRRDPVLLSTTLGSAACWLLLALLGQDILIYTKSDLALGDGLASLPPALFGLGLGLGGLLAGRLSDRGGAMGLVPIGALAAAGLLVIFAAISPGLPLTMGLAAMIGLATGMVIVPLDGMIQRRAPSKRRGAVIAIGNLFVFSAMLGGSLLAAGLARSGLDTLDILLVAAVLALAGGAWAISALPTATARILLRAYFRLAHGARFRGLENIPARGAALLCPNHVSFIDWAYISCLTERPVRFLVEKSWFERRLWRPLLAASGAIPITATEGPRALISALRRAGEVLDRGELVCIFAEGEISRTGDLLPFRRGFLRLAEGRDLPILPVALSGLDQSRFAPGHGGARRPRPVIARVGKALRAPEPRELREAVLELIARSARERAREIGPLHELVLRQARTQPRARAWVADDGTTTSWSRAAAGALILARRLQEQIGDDERLAILLPPSPAAALANLAASMGGRVSVNLNFSAGAAAMKSALDQCSAPAILTSRRFIEKLKPELPTEARLLFLEDLMAEIGLCERLVALTRVKFRSRAAIEHAAGAGRSLGGDDIATIIFSSGSTGEPKGIQLSHRSVSWNAQAALGRAPLGREDLMIGCLPTFHSFGFMSLWLAAAAGMTTAFQANPLDAAAIGSLAAREKATLLMATPSFLQLYLKRCEPGQFSSLRLVVCGAERLTGALAAAFEDRFGLRPLEGYGATECAPVIAMSGPDHRGDAVYQAGSRRGSVGRPLLGLDLKIVDPESFVELPLGSEGLITLRGPSLMQGYLGRPDLDALAFKDGAYLTGDIGRIDDDGFLIITDRLSRFAKIGGEMVPHGRVEDALQEASGREERVFAVTSLPDATKGESLAVLHTLDQNRVPDLIESLRAAGLPNLFIPKSDRFFRVSDLPMLASGKIDLARVKAMARDLAAAA